MMENSLKEFLASTSTSTNASLPAASTPASSSQNLSVDLKKMKKPTNSHAKRKSLPKNVFDTPYRWTSFSNEESVSMFDFLLTKLNELKEKEIKTLSLPSPSSSPDDEKMEKNGLLKKRNLSMKSSVRNQKKKKAKMINHLILNMHVDDELKNLEIDSSDFVMKKNESRSKLVLESSCQFIFGINHVTKMAGRNQIGFIFVCKEDISPLLLIEHLPMLCHSSKISLITLPRGSREKLSQLFSIGKVSIIGIRRSSCLHDSLQSFMREKGIKDSLSDIDLLLPLNMHTALPKRHQ